jgi:hypothetical protein
VPRAAAHRDTTPGLPARPLLPPARLTGFYFTAIGFVTLATAATISFMTPCLILASGLFLVYAEGRARRL